MDEGERKVATVANFKEIFKKIVDDKSTPVLYPYSTSLSATSISVIVRIPNTYMDLKWYILSLKPLVKNSNIVYGQIYSGTNMSFNDWKSNFLECTKENGHGMFLKIVQDERNTPIGYLLYTHKTSNAPWYQTILSKKFGIPIVVRFRKISGQKSKDRAVVHLEYARDNHNQVKEFLRLHCSKNTNPPY